MNTEKPSPRPPRRHGSAVVGIRPAKSAAAPTSLDRLIARRARLQDALKRASDKGPKHAGLQAEVERIERELQDVQKQLTTALAPPSD